MALTATSAATVNEPSFSEAVPMPPFIARWMPKSLPTVAPRPAPALPWAGGSLRRGLAGRVAGVGAGADARVADPQIEQHRRRHDGHARRPHLQAVAVFVVSQRITPDAASSPKALPPVSSTACTHSTVFRAQQIGLARAGRAAAHGSTPQVTPWGTEHHGAAGGRPAAAAWPTVRPAMSVRLRSGSWVMAAIVGSPLDASPDQAKTPAVSCMRPTPRPGGAGCRRRLSSSIVRRLK
jgi:hypothetical protein